MPTWTFGNSKSYISQFWTWQMGHECCVNIIEKVPLCIEVLLLVITSHGTIIVVANMEWDHV